MLTIRSFTNTDPAIVLSLWNHNSKTNPNRYVPVHKDVLESQIFGNTLFDPASLLIAFMNGVPVGFIHASFGPDQEGEAVDPSTGIVFSPILQRDMPGAPETAKLLIAKAEQYLLSRGATHWFAGGLGKESPFYTGLYGLANPFGIFSNDAMMLDVFESMNYQPFRKSTQYCLDVRQYHAPVKDTYLQAYRQYRVCRNASWGPRNWWDSNIYRNFDSYEWNVFPRECASGVPDPIAGTVIHQMLVPAQYVVARHCILSFIGVVKSALRHGIGSVLFSSMINDLQYENCNPETIGVSIAEENRTLATFLEYHGFVETGGYTSMGKMPETF